MQKIIRSKHLLPSYIDNSLFISHRNYTKVLKGTLEAIEIIDLFYKPVEPESIIHSYDNNFFLNQLVY